MATSNFDETHVLSDPELGPELTPHLSLMTNSTAVRIEDGTKLKSWREIVVEVMQPHRGETLPLATLYPLVEQHPDAIARVTSNRFIRPRIRETLQRLRDRGVVVWDGPGQWRLPADPTAPGA